jgi:hypothetical protein
MLILTIFFIPQFFRDFSTFPSSPKFSRQTYGPFASLRLEIAARLKERPSPTAGDKGVVAA